MHLLYVLNSTLKAGNIAYLISLGILIECVISFFTYYDDGPEKTGEMMTHLRVGITLIFVLINGINKSSFIFVVFGDDVQTSVFVCWAIHTFGFIVFLLNMLNSEAMFNTLGVVDFIYRVVFYAILISNSLFFMMFMLFSILISVLIVSCPTIMNRYPRLAAFVENFIRELNEFNLNPNDVNRPLNDIELKEMKSIVFENPIEDCTCSICMIEIKKSEKCVFMENCAHFFHSECIRQWMKVKPECPMCRKNVRKEEQLYRIVT